MYCVCQQAISDDLIAWRAYRKLLWIVIDTCTSSLLDVFRAGSNRIVVSSSSVGTGLGLQWI